MATRNYNPSTVAVSELLNSGLRVETGIVNAHSGATPIIFHQGVTTLFTVYGAIRVNALFGECTTIFSADAVVGRFVFRSTTPVVAQADISADSAALTSLKVGQRFTCQGDAVATACVITASAGISLWPLGKLELGMTGCVGVIEIDADAAAVDLTTGAIQFVLCYTPISDGAYAVAAI
jgi:hypothetical protein